MSRGSRRGALLAGLVAFAGCPAPAEESACEEPTALFGAPTESTGLDAEACAPACAACGEAPWVQPTYTAADFADWRAWLLTNAPETVTTDPYALPAPAPPAAEAVCAVLPAGAQYQLVDFGSSADALAAGAAVTHFGICGRCSSLTDLAVYAEHPDLTEPVRACGMAHLDGDIPALTACIAAIGFTEPCASIWAWNTVHTREACMGVCLEHYDAPYNEPDGSLNPCLQCDEDASGEVFLAVAGRTRRNTGLASSMCRPCAEVRPLVHAYGAPTVE